MIQEVVGVITVQNMFLFLGVALFACGVAAVVTLAIGKTAAEHVHKVDYRKLVFAIVLFLGVLVFVYTGFCGVLVCLTGVAIGVLPNLLGVKKSLLMSCLIGPTILYLTGTDYVVLGMLGL